MGPPDLLTNYPLTSMPETMDIEWERYGRCMWHADCDKSKSGVVTEVAREHDRTLVKCLHCGRHGYYPVGGIGCVRSIVVSSPDQPGDSRP